MKHVPVRDHRFVTNLPRFLQVKSAVSDSMGSPPISVLDCLGDMCRVFREKKEAGEQFVMFSEDLDKMLRFRIQNARVEKPGSLVYGCKIAALITFFIFSRYETLGDLEPPPLCCLVTCV